jgi:hypothetical protein
MRDFFNCNKEEKIDFLNKASLMGEGQGEGELETLHRKGSLRGAQPLLVIPISLPLEGEGQGEGDPFLLNKNRN